MYQYEFFDKRAYDSKPKPLQKVPDGFITIDEVELIRSSYWAEHCLECAEPLCYGNCEHFSRRWDDRCRRFTFGIYDNPDFPDFPFHSEMRFRKWGKLESIVYPGAMTAPEALAVDSEWKDRCREKCRLMRMGAIGRRIYPIKARQEFDASKYTYSKSAGSTDRGDTPDFLLQAYSYESEPFGLMFDITDDTDLAFRERIELIPGYNQALLDVSRVFPSKGVLRAKLYPEGDREADIVLLFCEFVALSNKVSRAGVEAKVGALAGVDGGLPAKKVKCVAWDLDNTVWDGILMESDPEALELRPGILDAMRKLDERGIIQICASKNDESEVVPVLDRLGIRDMFVGLYVNWTRKSVNLLSAADDININIDTFALVDDSPFERNEVSETLPVVRVFTENEIEVMLTDPAFDVPVTEDSRNRRNMYQTENLRKRAARDIDGGELDFLRSCEICGTVKRPTTPGEIKRGYELVQRTNQLNLSGNKYSEEEFAALLERDGSESWVAFCEDRFGAYGQILFMQTHIDVGSGHLVVDEFAMSCRVAGKHFESALVAALLERSSACGVELLGRKTQRNGLLVRTFSSMGFEDEGDDECIRMVLKNVDKLRDPKIVDMTIE